MKRLLNTKNFLWCCHHLHIDKSKIISSEILHKSQVHMKDKWYLMEDIKKNYNKNDLKIRMINTTTDIVNQGCNKLRTFIDIDSTIKLNALEVALEVKDYWKNKNVELQLGTQLLEGLETK